MKVKGFVKKLHRVNPNGVICDSGSLDKLRAGEKVELSEDAANELIGMGFVEKVKQTKKKELKNG